MKHSAKKVNMATKHFLEEMDAGIKHIIERAEAPVRLHADLLAIACQAYREGKEYLETHFIYPSHAIPNPKPEDVDLANKIRKYYIDKLTLGMLQGRKQSMFRLALMNFLSADNVNARNFKYDSKILGMACRLPAFYHYDIALENLMGSKYRKLNNPEMSYNVVTTLRFKNRLLSLNKRHPGKEYWFEDQHGDMCMIRITKDNPLDSLFYNLVTQKDIVVKGHFYPKIRDDMEFLDTSTWEFCE